MKSIFLWLLLILLLSYMVINFKVYEEYTEYEYIDYPGNNIGSVRRKQTYANCEALCNNAINPSCVGFVTQNTPTSGNVDCWLKSKIDTTSQNSGQQNLYRYTYIK